MVSSFHQFHRVKGRILATKKARVRQPIGFFEADFPLPPELVANLFLVPAFFWGCEGMPVDSDGYPYQSIA